MNKSLHLSKQCRIVCMFGLCFVFFVFLMYCAPMASDDLEFLTLDFSGITDTWNYVLYYGNGRILGNLGAVCLVQMPVLTVLIKSFLISGIIFLIPSVLGIHNSIGLIFSFLLFTAIPGTLFGEVYAWTSGFQNYIPPVWITLVILYLINQYDSIRSKWLRIFCSASIFILGIAGQLYVEHSTLHNLVLACGIVYCRRRNARSVKPAVIWLLASVLGAFCMVLTPVIFYVENNRTGSYRSFNFDGIVQTIISCKNSFISIATAFPFVGTLVTSGFVMITTWMTKDSRSKKWNKFLYDFSLLAGLYTILNEILRCDIWLGKLATLKYIITGIFTFSPFVLWIIALIPLADKELRNKIYGLLCLAVAALLPLLVVSPTPDRVVYLAYVCTACAILLFSDYLVKKMDHRTYIIVRRSVQYITVIVVFLLCMTFSNILWLNQIRETHIKAEMAEHKTEINIFRIPYDYAFWDDVGSFGRGYFYENWYDITFHEVEYTEW